MHNPTHHIISRCHWDTVFDAKKLANRFQMKISNWSNHHLSKEIINTLNRVCPKHQTIKINRLEVDLGIINYDELLKKLPLLLNEKLQDAIQELILNANSNYKAIEIIPEKISQKQLIRSFLINGVFPWNYNSKYGGINKITALQLSENKQQIIEMIKTIGTKAQVRKRMAWQFEDRNLNKIIEGLEPSNHKKITDFSSEFIRIHNKQNIIKTNTKDLKQNLWFWILNYLFKERGSLFNTLAFVKSSITQMAAHYNITYENLLVLINNAVIKIDTYTYVKKGLISILEMLYLELQIKPISLSNRISNTTDYWQYFTEMLNGSPNKNTKISASKINDLILILSKENPQKFTTIFNRIHYNLTQWELLSKQLNDVAIKTLFITILKERGKITYNQISFLINCKTHKILTISKHKLYALGLQFIIKQQHSSSTISFIDFFVNSIAKARHKTKISIAKKIIKTQTPQSVKTTTYISIQKELNTFYTDLFKVSKSNSSTQLSVLFERLAQHTSNRTQLINEAEDLLHIYITNDPKKIWACIAKANASQSSFIAYILPELLSNTDVKQFLKHTKIDCYKGLVAFEEVLHELQNRSSKTASITHLKRHIFNLGLEVLIVHKPTQLNVFIIQLIKHSKYKFLHSDAKSFNNVIKSILTNDYTRRMGLTKSQQQNIAQNITSLTTTNLVDDIKELMHKKGNAYQISPALKTVIQSAVFHSPTFKTIEKKVLIYFLSEAQSLQKAIINYTLIRKIQKKYAELSSTDIQTILTKQFWLTLANYKDYKGDKTRFKNALEKTIQYRFTKAFNNTPITTSKKRTNSNYRLSKTEQLKVIKYLFLKSKTVKQLDYNHNITMQYVLENYTADAIKIINNQPLDNTTITRLQDVISFQQFTAIIARKHGYKNTEITTAMHVLYQLLKTANISNPTIEHKFWEQYLKVLRSQTSKVKTLLIDLVNFSLQQQSITVFKSTEFIKKIIAQNIQIPSTLQEILSSKSINYHQSLSKTNLENHSCNIKDCIANKQINSLCTDLIINNTIPSWFTNTNKQSISVLLEEILKTVPLVFLTVLRTKNTSQLKYKKLANTISLTTLCSSLEQLYPDQRQEIASLHQFYKSIPLVNINSVPTQYIQDLLYVKLLKAWATANWNSISSTHIWNELIWDLCTKKNAIKKDILNAFISIIKVLPISLQVSLKSILPKQKPATYTNEISTYKTNKTEMEENNPHQLDTFIQIHNAGLVLLNGFIKMLFDRLDLLEGSTFKNEENQLAAVHYLQYIVTGQTETEEALLSLNKILCGLSLNTPIKSSIKINDKTKELIDSMIQAAIKHWPECGSHSTNGFRGNWLVRDGVLSQEEERWQLNVEKRAYDLLLNKSLFSFSIIKLPWMHKPLHVEWPY